MNAAERKIQNLHELLADIYRQSPYITVKNTHTENLWREIEKQEGEL
jgi:hypothetical protein